MTSSATRSTPTASCTLRRRAYTASRNVPASFMSREPPSRGSGSTSPDGTAGYGAVWTIWSRSKAA
ncbi:MAG: hypothetical protein HGA97_00950 [Chlorobiaceae bacterium]|nr:hypothetical protein [Chlorobiaceae bacterium]